MGGLTGRRRCERACVICGAWQHNVVLESGFRDTVLLKFQK